MIFNNNRDRGSVKWTAMMLPEHVKEIRTWYQSDNEIPDPEYDEFSLSNLADELNIAYQTKSIVRILYWKNKRTEEYEGQIVELFPSDHAVKIRLKNTDFKLKLEHILKVDIYD